MSRRSIALPAAFFALVAVAAAFFGTRGDNERPVGEPIVAPSPLTEARIRDRDIEFYSRRLVEDPSSAADRATLAKLFLARSGSTGSQTDLATAERLARESITERETRNYQAFELLATALMGRHEFREAHSVAVRVNDLNPGNHSHLALLGEIELELGLYDEAARHFEAISYDGRNFTTGARLARWYELTGRTERARALLRRSIVKADRRDDLPREHVAWFHYRLGELELKAGNPGAADSSFRRGLAVNPEDPRILGGLAHAAFTSGSLIAAIDYAKRAVATRGDPEAFGILSAAHARLGDTAAAARYAQMMSQSVAAEPGVINRDWGFFVLDYGTAADHRRVLQLARKEARERKDVYAHDLLAWALYRNGHIAEARHAMTQALAQCTEDVNLREHARIIGVDGSCRRQPAGAPIHSG